MIEDIWQIAIENPDTLSAISGLGASLAALLAILLSTYSLATQRQHNRISVRPIANFGYVDFENEISIWLRNSGIGPLKIDALTTRCNASGSVRSTLIEQMFDKGIADEWETFSGNINGKTLRAGGVLHLLKLKGDQDDPDFTARRDTIRKALLSIELKVTYSDLYHRKIGTEVRELSFFGRHYHKYDFEAKSLQGITTSE